MNLRLLILPVLFLLATLFVHAQRPVGFAYYDVDRLYDTIPALFYNDEDFTPEGQMNWTSQRYHRKIQLTAAVLDSMRMDLVALSGIESEEVVRDLASACREAYCYLHRTLNSFDGLDIALLYHADRFDPDFADEGRGWLYIEGDLDNIRVGLLICRNTRYASEALTDCIISHPNVNIIASGRLSIKADHSGHMADTHARAEAAGRGNIRYSTGWRMGDRILVDTSLQAHGGDVYARGWLMDREGISPYPTYQRNAYRGGYSRSLPVFVYLTPVIHAK